MIISHKYRFIFLKTGKTAGTSIEIALSKFCGPDDIITPITHEDERERAALGYRGPQNYFVPMSEYSIRDWGRLLRTGKKARFYNHISGREVRDRIGARIWNEYYKFCFVRNPWDRLISLYYWHYREEPRPSMAEFVDSRVPDILRTRGIEIYTIDERVAVDRVCRYERLGPELEEVAGRLGLPEALALPRAKGSARKDRRSYRDVLSREDGEKIARMFSKEIELFGYTYEP
jgi:hypothetical protein